MRPHLWPAVRLLERIENKELPGYTSAHVVALAHRLMTIEAAILLSWPLSGMANWLDDIPPRQRLTATVELPTISSHPAHDFAD